MIMHTDPEKMLESHRIITNYLLTGEAPPGIRPEVLDLCADIIAATPPRFRLPCHFTHRVERRGRVLAMTKDFQRASDFAAFIGGSVKTNLKVIK